MNPKRYGTSFGLLDILLLWFIFGGGWFTLTNFENYDAGVIIVPLAALWFVWRRGWIKMYLDQQKAQQNETRVAEKRAKAAKIATSPPLKPEAELIASPPLQNEQIESPIQDETSLGFLNMMLLGIVAFSYSFTLIGFYQLGFEGLQQLGSWVMAAMIVGPIFTPWLIWRHGWIQAFFAPQSSKQTQLQNIKHEEDKGNEAETNVTSISESSSDEPEFDSIQHKISFGVLDIFLLWGAGAGIAFIIIVQQQLGVAGLQELGIWTILATVGGLIFTPWFIWRRGWIQAFLYPKAEFIKEEADEEETYEENENYDDDDYDDEDYDEEDYDNDSDEIGDDQFLPSVYAIAVPQGVKWQPNQAIGLIHSLRDKSKQGHLLLSIQATHQGISWLVTYVSESHTLSLKDLENVVRAYYPGAQVSEYDPLPYSLPLFRRYMLFERNATNYFDPSITATQLRQIDPLATLVQTMGGLKEEEELRYDIFIPSLVQHAPKDLENILTISAYDAGMRSQGGIIQGKGVGGEIMAGMINSVARAAHQQFTLKKERLLRFSEAETTKHLQKLQEPLFLASLSISFDTPHPTRMSLFSAVSSAAKALSSPEVKLDEGYASPSLTVKTTQVWKQTTPMTYLLALAPEKRGDIDETEPFFFYLTADELAAFWHLPHQSFTTDEIQWAQNIPTQVLGEQIEGAIVGSVGTGASAKPVTINQHDRAYHAYITGQTGMGKSTLMHNIIHQDIAHGYGVMVLDPHGSLIRDLLTASIPTTRQDDVVYLEAGNTDYPIPLNPLRVTGDASEASVFNTVMWIIKSIYASSWSETLMETTFRNILQVILSDPHATPLDITELIENPDYRRRMLIRAQKSGKLSRAAKNYWKRFEELSPSKRQSTTQSALNRLGAFLGSKPVELMTCHRDTLDFRKLIQEKKIVLVDLSNPAIASEVGSLGAIFFAQVFLASLSLGINTDGQPPRFYLFVDETQRFITTTLPNMFSEARKFGLSLTLTNQYIGQLDPDTRAGISNNVGTKFSFEAAPDEAVMTAKLYEPEVQADDLKKLGVGRVAIRTRFQGQTLPGFIANTPQKPSPYAAGLALDTLKQQSRERLGLLSTVDVEAWLDTRYEGALFAIGSDDETELTDFDTRTAPEPTPTPPSEITDFEDQEDMPSVSD